MRRWWANKWKEKTTEARWGQCVLCWGLNEVTPDMLDGGHLKEKKKENERKKIKKSPVFTSPLALPFSLPTPLLAPSLVLCALCSAEAAHAGCLLTTRGISSHHNFGVTLFPPRLWSFFIRGNKNKLVFLDYCSMQYYNGSRLGLRPRGAVQAVGSRLWRKTWREARNDG